MIKPQFPKFRISELIQFNHDAVTICKSNGVPELPMAELMYNLQQATAALDNTFKLEQGSAISAEIIQADARRDTAITGIRLIANSFTYHFDPSLQLAGEAIVKSIDKYGDTIQRLNYQAETSTITSITDSWINDVRLNKAINDLKLADWANELKLANDKFNQLFMARVEEKGNTQKAQTLELRHAAIENYRVLATNIEAYRTITSNGSYTPIINQLNELTNKYNALVNTRSVHARVKLDAASNN